MGSLRLEGGNCGLWICTVAVPGLSYRWECFGVKSMKWCGWAHRVPILYWKAKPSWVCSTSTPRGHCSVATADMFICLSQMKFTKLSSKLLWGFTSHQNLRFLIGHQISREPGEAGKWKAASVYENVGTVTWSLPPSLGFSGLGYLLIVGDDTWSLAFLYACPHRILLREK